MSTYLVSREGSKFGPYKEAEARQYYLDRNIASTDFVRCEGMTSWLTALEVFGPFPEDVSQSGQHGLLPPVPPPFPQAQPLANPQAIGRNSGKFIADIDEKILIEGRPAT